MRLLPAFALLLTSAPVFAQLSPTPSFDDPRLQTVIYQPNIPIRLITFPDASLKVMFHSGEAIRRVVLSDGAAFSAAVMARGDAVEIKPVRDGASATMRVETDQRQYEFALETGSGLAAAYLVRLVPGENRTDAATSQPAAGAPLHAYRLKGDRILHPDAIYDDGYRTFLEWNANSALPAVFGIGPSGEEELVAGYMRGGKFVIDRIYPELVFRFDKEKATARRQVERN